MSRVVAAILVIVIAAGAVSWYAAGSRERAEASYDRAILRVVMTMTKEENRGPDFERIYDVDERPWTADDAYEAALDLTPPPSRQDEHAEWLAGMRALSELNDLLGN